MWHRFTRKARAAIYWAQDESKQMGETRVTPEHLLLGLIRETCSASEVLTKLGVDLAMLQLQVRERTVKEDFPKPEVAMTETCKAVLNQAFYEARELNQDWVGTEHLLAGVIRVQGTQAEICLVKAGVSLARFRSALSSLDSSKSEERKARGSTDSEDAAKLRRTDETRRLLRGLGSSDTARVASLIWLMRNQNMAVEFLGIFALADTRGHLARFLDEKGLEPMVVAAAIENYLLKWSGQLAYTDKPSVSDVLALAQDLAKDGRQGPEHLVLALLKLGHNGVSDIFKELGLEAEQLEKSLKSGL